MCSFVSYGGSGPKKESSNKTTSEKSAEYKEIKKLSSEAIYQVKYQNDFNAYDSIFSKAMDISEKSWNYELKLKTQILYLNSIPAGYQNPILLDRINAVNSLLNQTKDDKVKFEAYLAICHALTHAQGSEIAPQLKEAQSYAIKAIHYADTHNTESKVKAGLNLSQVYLAQNLDIDAYESLLSTNLILEQHPEIKTKYSLKYKEALYNLFLKVEAYEKAAQVKSKIIQQIKETHPTDELALQWQKFDMAFLNYTSDIEADIYDDILSIARYGKSHDNDNLLESSLSLLRSYLIDKLDLSTLKKVFNVEYEKFMEEKKNGVPLDQYIYYTTIAYMSEAEDDINEAERFSSMASEIVLDQNNQYRKANFLMRLGEFYERHSSDKKAQEMYKMSLDISREVSFHRAILQNSEYLLSYAIEEQKEDFNSAYHYQKLIQDAKEKLNSQEENTRLLLLELENKEKLATIKEQQYITDKKNRVYAQYTIIILILTSFFIGFLAVSRLRVRPWVIEMLGFFNFILVFEFIILLIDTKLHDMTHGEPLIMFAVKVVLIIFLYPLHHYLEHISVKYLKEKKALLAPSQTGLKSVGTSLWPWLFSEKKESTVHNQEENISRIIHK